MKSIKQKLENIFFNIDFTNAIGDGIREYNRQCGYKPKEQADSSFADEKKVNSAACLHQQLTFTVPECLKVAW